MCCRVALHCVQLALLLCLSVGEVVAGSAQRYQGLGAEEAEGAEGAAGRLAEPLLAGASPISAAGERKT